MFFLNRDNKEPVRAIIDKFIDTGIEFKLQENVRKKDFDLPKNGSYKPEPIPNKGKELESILEEFKDKYLPSCENWSSVNFMGFPDAGNSVPAICASLLADLLHQNLANQQICGPSATFIEIDVIQWMRSVIGYPLNLEVKNVKQAGGVVIPGGTLGNAIGIMLARENVYGKSISEGLYNKDKKYIVVPKGIGHYSVKAAQMWLGCGNYLLEVDTKDFAYDIEILESVLKEHKNEIMCVIAYAGDSRTQTIENFEAVYRTVRAIDKNIWLHADACHGFALGFSKRHKSELRGIEKFDSISIDPHKALDVPYNLGILLVKDPDKIDSISTISDLILEEDFAFGQITPFIGSKAWYSLRLWFMLKNMGQDQIGKLIDRRIEIAKTLHEKLEKSKHFITLNEVKYNSVMFLYNPNKDSSIDELNDINRKIYSKILEEGKYYLHQFGILDRGVLKEGEILYPLRFMSGNPNIKSTDLDKMMDYVQSLGKIYANKSKGTRV